MVSDEPVGWPGVVHREGRTVMRVAERPVEGSRGPAAKGGGTFLNPAMSGSRTRSVLLLQHAIESGILGDGAIYALDGLAATGVRARRWINELPQESADRLDIVMGDLDEESLSWAMNNHLDFPPSHGRGKLRAVKGDLRAMVLNHGRHWVDIDPYGSPVPFLDTAVQSLARGGVIEVSATDTAALTGSSKDPLLRRYGARVRTDGLAHDSALRVLLATLARTAAKHDRAIVPLISIWDSHHLRVSARTIKKKGAASEVEDNLGWRVHSPSVDEVSSSIRSGLHPETSLEKLPMDCMLPLSHPVMRGDSRVSGPLWIGSMGDQGAMASMTEERALAMCTDSYGEGDVAGWSEADFERESRRVSRSVKNIHEESGVIDSPHHIIVDDLSSWLGIQGPPSPRSLVECLKERGFRAGLTHYGKPSIRTDAPWDEILEATMSLQPPM